MPLESSPVLLSFCTQTTTDHCHKVLHAKVDMLPPTSGSSWCAVSPTLPSKSSVPYIEIWGTKPAPPPTLHTIQDHINQITRVTGQSTRTNCTLFTGFQISQSHKQLFHSCLGWYRPQSKGGEFTRWGSHVFQPYHMIIQKSKLFFVQIQLEMADLQNHCGSRGSRYVK